MRRFKRALASVAMLVMAISVNAYHWQSPYAYCNNNPVRFIDPDGKKIQIPETKDRNTILNYINSMTITVYSIDNKGFLYDTGKQKDNGGSKLYTSRINDAINKEDLSISIYIDQNYVDDGLIKDISSKGEGVTQKEDDQAVAVVISGKSHKTKDENGNYFNQSPEEILMHELIGHAIPIIAPSRLFDTGNAILNENKVRKELNLQIRQENEGHKQ